MVRSKKALIGIALIIAVAVSSFAILASMQVGKASPNPIVVPDPPEIIIPPCETGDVAICVENFTGVCAFQFQIWWLKDVVNYTGYEWKPYPPEWPTPFTVGPSFEENATHKAVKFGIASIVPTPFSYEGRWPFIDLYWHCLKPDADSPLIFDRAETYLLDEAGLKIPIEKIVDGLVINIERAVYRYKVKVECGWQRVVIQPCNVCMPSQRLTVETLIETHINVYNPNDVPVEVTKKFVRVLPEECREMWYMNMCHWWCDPLRWDGRTCHIHLIVPPQKGFEIDCEDIQTWPPDPENPIQPLTCEKFWKGFVIIESPTQYIDPTTGLVIYLDPLEVVAVYNKESADMVDKITYKVHTHICGYIDTLRGRYKLYEPYELSVVLPFEPENITLPQLVKRELGIVLPFEPEDVDVDIKDVALAFDFLECVMKQKIVFVLRATAKMWEKYLDAKIPPELDWRSLAETWPGWPWPEETYEMKKQEKFCEPWQEVIVDPVANIRGHITTTLIDLGVPENITRTDIMPVIEIEILDIDVGKGVGTSVDVEYIEPEYAFID